MEPYEINELKRDITADIKKDITRSTDKLIIHRIVLTLVVLFLEAMMWAVITTAVVKDHTIPQGISVSLIVALLRIGQITSIVWFK